MNNPSGVYRRWRRRAMTVLGLALTTATAAALPALAHPNFPTGAGFANTMGSTTNPYPPGTPQTLNMYLPFEQQGITVNGADNTTVDTQVTIPTGWTNPACGNASTATDPNHAGTVVPGWACAVETTADGHQVLHWHGPQIGPPPLSGDLDSAQFFTFQVTVPSPATTTSYGATGSAAEGFFVQQVYADNTTELWRSPNDTTRPTATTAFGLVRTVAGTSTPTPSPTATPTPSPTATPTPSPTATPTPTSTPRPTPTPTPTATSTPTPSPTPTATSTPTPSPAPTATPIPRPTPTPSPRMVKSTITLSVIQVPLPFNLGGFAIPIATVAPSNAAGRAQFFDGRIPLSGTSPIISGIVVGPLRSLPPGPHSITAVFTPANPADFLSSISNTVTFRF